MARAAATKISALDPGATNAAARTQATVDRGAIATNGETNPRVAPWRMHCGSY
jgi:hypothetical protein